MGLSKCADTTIGDSEERGISRGERKRLAIAMEFLSAHSIIFLDEPTSGLDAASALSLMKCLSSLVQKESKTLILTIHQPRQGILELFSSIFIIAGGRAVYHGSVKDALPHFEGLGHACPKNTNPADFFLDIASIQEATAASADKDADRLYALQTAWADVERSKGGKEAASPSASMTPFLDESPYNSTWLQEFLMIFQRALKLSCQDATKPSNIFQFLFLLALFALPRFIPGPTFTELSGFVTYSLLYLYSALVQACTPLCLIIPLDAAKWRRERWSSYYRLSSAILGNVLAAYLVRVAANVILMMAYILPSKCPDVTLEYIVDILLWTCILSFHICCFTFLVGSYVTNKKIAPTAAILGYFCILIPALGYYLYALDHFSISYAAFQRPGRLFSSLWHVLVVVQGFIFLAVSWFWVYRSTKQIA